MIALNKKTGQSDEMTSANGMAAGCVIKRMAPGASGTRRLAERFGESLVCVRYRENAAQGLRYTTVEIIPSLCLRKSKFNLTKKELYQCLNLFW